MSNLEPLRQASGLPDTTDSRSLDRYARPSLMTAAGQLDRRHEADHIVRTRDAQRSALEGGAEQARAAYVKVARQEAMGRVTTEAKFKLHRAHKESAILAEDDPVLQAQFAALDDTLTQGLRIGLLQFFGE